MLVWNMDKNNDLQMDSRGQIQVVSALKALRIRIDGALQVVKGEIEEEGIGVDYFGVIFSNTPLSLKIQEITRVIKTIDEVQDVKFLKIEIDKKKSQMAFYFEITSIYGDFLYDYTFENV